MRITDSSIYFKTEHSWSQKTERQERLRAWIGEPPPGREGPPRESGIAAHSIPVTVTLPLAPAKSTVPEKELESQPAEREISLEILIVEKLIQLTTGRTVKITSPGLSESPAPPPALPVETTPESASSTERQGWGVEFSRVDTFSEEERLEVQAVGILKSQKGEEIHFKVALKMDRVFMTQESLNIRAGDAAWVDPLVINWDGRGVRLSESRTNFDLNNDGTPETVSWLQSGSGFLALDENQDGLVNNGRELFGPQSGNGFAELAQYDQDGSGWIDENDPVFSRLRVWTKDPDGMETLRTLADQRVGAIFLGSTDSPFQLTNYANESLGEVVRSGLYVKEDGSVGFAQQINLTA